jgi:hypothetical protein
VLGHCSGTSIPQSTIQHKRHSTLQNTPFRGPNESVKGMLHNSPFHSSNHPLTFIESPINLQNTPLRRPNELVKGSNLYNTPFHSSIPPSPSQTHFKKGPMNWSKAGFTQRLSDHTSTPQTQTHLREGPMNWSKAGFTKRVYCSMTLATSRPLCATSR